MTDPSHKARYRITVTRIDPSGREDKEEFETNYSGSISAHYAIRGMLGRLDEKATGIPYRPYVGEG